MLNKWKFLCIVLLLALCIVGFSKLAQHFTEPVYAETTTHQWNDLKLEWSIAPAPAKSLQPNPFILTLVNDNDIPIEQAQITVKLEMNNMFCGTVQFSLTEHSPGVYVGEGIPLMAGVWSAEATLSFVNTVTAEIYIVERYFNVTV